MSRPTKLTPNVRERIVESIRAGAYAEQAARAAGIAPSTYYDWLRRGEAGEPTFSEFSEALRACEAEAEVAAVATIRDAAQAGDWRAAAHYLERRHPERWGRRARPGLEHAEVRGDAPADFDGEVELLLGELQQRPTEGRRPPYASESTPRERGRRPARLGQRPAGGEWRT